MAIEVGNTLDFKLPPTLDVIRGNIVRHGNPLALSGTEVASWAKSLGLPRKGEFLLYTGGEYQLLPYIESLIQTMSKMDTGSKGFSLMMGVRNLFDRVGINAEKLYASVLAKDRDRFNSISYKAAVALQKLGFELCYLGEQELYSGALLYEFGYWEDLRKHAAKVAELIKQTGAKTVICLSPHSAEVFKLIYPRLVEDFHVEAKTFVQVVWERLQEQPGRLKVSFPGPVVIHDSCRLARELGITEEIRQAIGALGDTPVREASMNRRWTSCCGGPSKVLFPELSGMISGRRVNELADTGAEMALTFCPYCLAALELGVKESGKKIVIEDFTEFLYRGIAQ